MLFFSDFCNLLTLARCPHNRLVAAKLQLVEPA